MLITFKSKAYQNVLMYQEHAKRILDLLGKDGERGVITAEESARAVDMLENEIEESRKHQATDNVEQDVKAHSGDDRQDTDHEPVETVSFSTRAYPLLEMMRASRDQHADILWGV
jgi:polyhydroxyalkanoate synthesis regulator phasin